MQRLVITLSGSSGCGKTSLIRAVIERLKAKIKIKQVPSLTTRALRDNEQGRIFVEFAPAAHAATSGGIGSSTSCYIKINESLLRKRGTQYAKVKFKTYDLTGKYNTKAKVRFTLYDGDTGRYITSWVGRGGDTLRLGDDHSSYRLSCVVYEEPVTGGIISRTIKGGNNFSNVGKAVTWRVSNPQNCTIS